METLKLINFRKIIPFFLLLYMHPSYGQVRQVQLLQEGWKFRRGSEGTEYTKDFDDSSWENVMIPHDWAIDQPFQPEGESNTGKLPWKGQGWYRYNLDTGNDYKDKRLYLLFDGIMAFPAVYINGKLAGRWDYGYNSFYLDITDFIDYRENNVLAVHVDTRNHRSRWYPGAGIYRKVRLIAVNPIHVDIWGTYITTPEINSDYAKVSFAVNVNNHSAAEEEINMVNIIRNKDGREIYRKEIIASIRESACGRLETDIILAGPHLWNLNDPYLYSLLTEIYKNGELTDTHQSHFGIRKMSFDADHGFFLNDRRIPLKGVNLHHDHGPLGAAFHPRAMERQLEILKTMGCNAIRTCHNTPAPELLELCDRMGILVLDEVFDKYDETVDILDTTNFEDFAYRNIRNFILRDRNHPSVFLWSVGNEIRDVQFNRENGFHRLHTMVNYVNKYDPTRPVTLACEITKSAKAGIYKYFDVHSWNYGRKYETARIIEPDKPVVITESSGTASSRGFYEFPLPEDPTDFSGSLQATSYDLNGPWWSDLPDETFMWLQTDKYVAGEFVWAGFDYLGEPYPYTDRNMKEMGFKGNSSRSSYYGIVDLCGIPKDRYYLYKSKWNEVENTVHILPHWNWQDDHGNEIPVFVYTSGDCAELFLNGKSLGTKCKQLESENPMKRFRLMWKEVNYKPGTLKAVAYKQGVEIGEAVVQTTGKAVRLRLSSDRQIIWSDGMDLSYILIEVLDSDGNVCPLADNLLKINVTGPARFTRVGNGNPQSMNSFKSESIPLFFGKAMLIVGSGFDKGKVKIEVSSEELKTATMEVVIK